MHTKFFGLLLASAVWVSCATINSARPDLSSSNQESKNNGDYKLSRRQGIDDTIAHAEYLTEIERQVIMEINLVRTDPYKYARKYLVPMRSYYHNKLLQYPGEVAVSTVEGLRALDECIKELQAYKSLLPLSPKKGLVLAARDHAEDLERTGKTGHKGSDGSTMRDRLNRYGRWQIAIGENIAYGHEDAGRIVTALLIDDGVPSRMHRRNLFNDTYKFVGVTVRQHRVYRYMCVIDFAGAYN